MSTNSTDKKFQSTDISVKDFKSLVSDIVSDTHPDDKINDVCVGLDGLVYVILESGEEIEIEVDWNETKLR